jgi:nickel and cobalt resistance protein CnrR
MIPLRPRLFPFLFFLVLVASIAATSCVLAERWMSRCLCQRQEQGHSWMHQKLGLNAEQKKKLEPLEQHYAEQKRHSEEMMKLANRELALAIVEDKEDSERVRTAIDKIHHAMGGLQKATLNHIFEMKGVLSPEQYEKLLQLTSQGLNEVSAAEK